MIVACLDRMFFGMSDTFNCAWLEGCDVVDLGRCASKLAPNMCEVLQQNAVGSQRLRSLVPFPIQYEVAVVTPVEASNMYQIHSKTKPTKHTTGSTACTCPNFGLNQAM